MKFCEAKHKKQTKAGERGLTLDQLNAKLAAARVGPTCGGTIEEVLSADGTKVYGERCSRCGKSATRCQVCGRMFANIDRHLFDRKGKPTPCHAGNPEYRTARAVESKMAKMGAIRA